ncbi:hypothetical protein [Catenuloplanes indicus]|uniref:Uncharacterized protein n=1 Tax=Catenuloplanes indicus TaxID=137267 RepID=A0AAE3W287_9ACTN|nr:hypothetical protein [Catenuloplanes indicus]MDQ0367947.1 hypothetical protein [Catenuloplanes indicus]
MPANVYRRMVDSRVWQEQRLPAVVLAATGLMAMIGMGSVAVAASGWSTISEVSVDGVTMTPGEGAPRIGVAVHTSGSPGAVPIATAAVSAAPGATGTPAPSAPATATPPVEASPTAVPVTPSAPAGSPDPVPAAPPGPAPADEAAPVATEVTSVAPTPTPAAPSLESAGTPSSTPAVTP